MNDDITTTPSEGSEVIGTTPAPEAAQPGQDVQATEQTTPAPSEGSEDSFFDPTQVPDELKPVYKGMQAAYTKKTQEIAAIRKEAADLKAQADKWSQYEQYVPIIDEMLKPKGEPASPEMAALEQQLKAAGYTDDAIELIKMGSQFTLSQFNQQQKQAEYEAKLKESGSVDPRLADKTLTYELPDGTTATFGDIVAQLAATKPNATDDPVAATKAAIAQLDAIIASSKTAGKAELSASAQAKATQFPSTSASPQPAKSGGSPATMAEAAEQAAQELGIALK